MVFAYIGACFSTSVDARVLKNSLVTASMSPTAENMRGGNERALSHTFFVGIIFISLSHTIGIGESALHSVCEV